MLLPLNKLSLFVAMHASVPSTIQMFRSTFILDDYNRPSRFLRYVAAELRSHAFGRLVRCIIVIAAIARST